MQINYFIKACSTSLLSTILLSSYSSQAASYIYDDDNSIVNTAIIGDFLRIEGTSTTTFEDIVSISREPSNNSILIRDTATPTFNDTVTTVKRIFIRDDSKPVFNSSVETSDDIFIRHTAAPIFNGVVTTNDNIVIRNDSAPIFNNAVDNKDNIVIRNNAKPIFNDLVTTNNTFIRNNSTPIFNSLLECSNEIRLEDNSVSLFNDNVNSDDSIFVRDAAKASFNGQVTAPGLIFQAVSLGSKVTLTGNSVLNTPITTTAQYTGDITLESGAIINQPIGELANPMRHIIFEPNDPSKTTIIKGDIYGSEFHLGNSKIDIQDNITLFSDVAETGTYDNTTLNLNGNKVSQHGTITNQSGDITLSTRLINKVDGVGEIEQVDGSFNMLDNTGRLIINVIEDPSVALPLKNVPEYYTLLSGNITHNPTYTLNNSNPFVVWGYTNGVLRRLLVDNSSDVLDDVVGGNPNVPQLDPDLEDEMSNIANSEGGDVADEAIDRLASSDAISIATTPVGRAFENATQSISDRANGFVSSPFVIASSGGVAAGDFSLRHGTWLSPFYGDITQRQRNGAPGYKARYCGAVIGVDTLINEDSTVGAALSFIKTNIKHKNINTGDKTKSSSYVGSLYGTYKLNNKWFTQGVASFSHNKINNKEVRLQFFCCKGIAESNYKSNNWAVEWLFGYNHKIGDKFLLTPTFGLEYNRMNQISYKETGTENQNLFVKRKAVNRVEAILGTKISTAYQYDNWLLTPELHGNIRYNVTNKKLGISIKQNAGEGSDLIPSTAKISRTIGNVGVALSAKKSEFIEYSVGYDVRIAEKYIGHQGTLKLRMNF